MNKRDLIDADWVEPKRHLIVDGKFFARANKTFSEDVDEKLVNMSDKIAVGLERMAQQASVT